MTRKIQNQAHQDVYEYQGNTAILLIRKMGSITVWRDWLLFDSVEEASEYFNTACCPVEG